MDKICEYDTVRIVKLLKAKRPFDGTEGVCHAPEVGDMGTVVHMYGSEGSDAAFIVENVDEEGLTIWLADFVREELECIRVP